MAKGAKKAAKKAVPEKPSSGTARVSRPYPRETLESALKVPAALKEKNGGNPWPPADVATAVGMSKASTRFFYLAAASREFGFTEGSRDSAQISLTPLGRSIVYAPNAESERVLKLEAFLKVPLFARVLQYYRGSDLPEMKYLGNTLTNEFGLSESVHTEFSDLFKENCKYLGIEGGFSTGGVAGGNSGAEAREEKAPRSPDTITLAEPSTSTGLLCFVIMPFRERGDAHPAGFFDEVLRSLITPAGQKAGFTVRTANRKGTDVIQSTIVNDLLDADLVIADLTEHNPNVLFELGLRLAFDKPVALIRARGTGKIFDVDNMLRVFDYEPHLWASTVESDLPKLVEHIEGTWQDRENVNTYMKILRRVAAEERKPAPTPP